MNKNDLESDNNDTIVVREIVQKNGSTPFRDWINSIRDKSVQKRIRRRIGQIQETGHMGPGRFPANSPISELAFDTGPGYRVYFVRVGEDIVILINGGVHNGQTGDIARAKKIWEEVVNGYPTLEEALQRCSVNVPI